MRAIRILAAVRLLGAVADGAILPFLVLWAHRDGGLSGAVAGLLFIAQAVGELTGGLVAGQFADRLGHRRTLLISTAGMAVGYGSICLLTLPIPALAALFVAGAFESAFHPTIGAMIGDVTPEGDLPHAFSVVSVCANAGQIVGPLLGACAVALSLRAVFPVAGGVLLAALAAVAALPHDSELAPEDDEVDAPGSATSIGVLARDPRLLSLVLTGGILAVTATWWETDGLVLLRGQRSLGTTAFAALFALAAAATVALQVPVTRWLRDRSPGHCLLLGSVVQAGGLGALAAASHGYGVLVGAVLVLATGQMIVGPAMATYVTLRAPRGRGAAYQAALSTTEDIGTAAGPASGLALGTLGARVPWLAAVPLCFAAGLAGLLATSTRGRVGDPPVAAVRDRALTGSGRAVLR